MTGGPGGHVILADLTQRPEDVSAAQENIDVLRADADTPLLGGHECVFHDMREPDRRLDVDDTGGALDRVGCAHERLDLLRVGRVALQREQALVEGRPVRAHLLLEQVHHRETAAFAHRILARNAWNNRVSSR